MGKRRRRHVSGPQHAVMGLLYLAVKPVELDRYRPDHYEVVLDREVTLPLRWVNGSEPTAHLWSIDTLSMGVLQRRDLLEFGPGRSIRLTAHGRDVGRPAAAAFMLQEDP